MQRLPLSRSTALLAIPLLLATAIGCKKEFDSPPVRTIPAGSVVNIAQLKAMYQGVPVHFPDTAGAITTLYAVVTADEQSGNLYKNLYIQDPSGAMAIRLLSSGGLYQGDSIRIHLPGTVLSPYNGLMQLDSIDVDNNIVKQATGIKVDSLPISINDLISSRFGLGGIDQGKLVFITGVQFIDGELGLTYADAIQQQTLNRTLENCAGATAVVRSSGYANFAGQQLPTGKGTFMGIASWFGNAAQLYIRDINEVKLDGPRCGQNDCNPVASLTEDFASVTNGQPIALDCWLNVFTQGSGIRRWRGGVGAAGQYAEGTVSGTESDTVAYWLVTPPLTYAAGMTLSFSSAIGSDWHHDGLSVYLSTDINLTNAAAVLDAPWQPVPTIVAGNASTVGEWIPSGNTTLPGNLDPGDTFVIGFRYVGTPALNTPYRIDNVVIQ